MNSNEFRKQLTKIMPGYMWTIHRSGNSKGYLTATGIQSSGFNRLSTLQITKLEKNGKIVYEATSSGFGTKATWLSDYTASTLARALRGLQNHYEAMAMSYSNHASALQGARKK